MDYKRDSVIDNHSSCPAVTDRIFARYPVAPWHDQHHLFPVAAPALSPVSPRLNWLVSVAVTHLSVGGRYPPGCAMQSRLSSPKSDCPSVLFVLLSSYKLVGMVGFEPTATRFQSGDSDQTELHPVKSFGRLTYTACTATPTVGPSKVDAAFRGCLVG
jgi:hypothetical protein